MAHGGRHGGRDHRAGVLLRSGEVEARPGAAQQAPVCRRRHGEGRLADHGGVGGRLLGIGVGAWWLDGRRHSSSPSASSGTASATRRRPWSTSWISAPAPTTANTRTHSPPTSCRICGVGPGSRRPASGCAIRVRSSTSRPSSCPIGERCRWTISPPPRRGSRHRLEDAGRGRDPRRASARRSGHRALSIRLTLSATPSRRT